MKRVYKLENLDCANCAAKMENRASKIDGVTKVSINFMTQRLTLEAEDERFDEILKQIEQTMKKIEKDVEIKK